jgi:hypothetical protein
VTSGDVCTLAVITSDCKLSEFPVAFPNNALSYASFAICLERVYCTMRYKHYDKNGAKPWLAAALIFCTWIIVVTNQVINWSNASKTKVTPVCENLLSVTPAGTTNTLVPQMTVEIGIVLLSLSVHIYNKHQVNNGFVNISKMSLSARFQLDQNVQLNRIVTPSMIFEAICYVPILLLLTLLNSGYEIELTQKVILVHFSYIWKLAFCILQPILGFRENPHLNKGLRNMCRQIWYFILNKKRMVTPVDELNGRKIGQRTVAASAKDAEVYFKNLQDQWAAPMGQSEGKKRCFFC